MIVCVAEDRKACEVSVRLLLLSLAKSTDSAVELFYPPASETFKAWVGSLAKVHLNGDRLPGAYGWNVKPHALLTLLNRGYLEVLWIDSDVIVTRDFHSLFYGLDRETIVVTEEALWGSHEDVNGMRARRWGFAVGRTLPYTANTAVIRVTRSHIPLLEEWKHLLESDEYKASQRLLWSARPTHMLGDQDVLTALLASTEFRSVPVLFLKRGKDIIHYFGPYGYTCRERIGNLRTGPPPFVHSQGGAKPFFGAKAERMGNGRQYFDAVYEDLSPYTLQAKRFRKQLDSDRSWMRSHSILASIFRLLGCGHPALVGFPLAMAADMVRIAKRLHAVMTARQETMPE